LAGFGSPPRRALDGSILLTGGPLSPLGCFDPDPSTAAVFFAPNTATIDTLTARALVLDNGARRLAIVKVDAIGMSRTLRDAVAAAAGPLGIPDAHVAVVATHTHSGPGGVSDQPAWEIVASDCYSQAVFDAVKSAAVLALSQAHAALTPAKIGIGSVQIPGVTRNRRPDFYPLNSAPLDTELGLIKVETITGTPIAALINFAIHGTWYDGNNMKVSADVMGAMEDEIEQALPAGAVAIFTNGAEGDVAPQKSATLDTAEKVGAVVAAKVSALWTSTPTAPTADLRAVFTDVTMPPAQYNGCLPLAESDTTVCELTGGGVLPTVPLPKWLPAALPFQALRINDTVLVAVPGEPVTELGTTIKQHAIAAGLARGYVVALANDHGGYFTTPAQYSARTYEGSATLYGPSTGATVVGAAGTVIDKVK
jgi:neutral ceramidase